MDLNQAYHMSLQIRYIDLMACTLLLLSAFTCQGSCQAELTFDFTHLRDFDLILPNQSQSKVVKLCM